MHWGCRYYTTLDMASGYYKLEVAEEDRDTTAFVTKFRWGTEQEKAFDELRQKLMDAPVLAYPNSEDVFILDTDASNHAIGAEWLQE